MIHAKGSTALCKDDYFIYAIGGTSYGPPCTDCEKYDVANDKWAQLPNLQQGKSGGAAIVFNNKYIYAIGGDIQERVTGVVLHERMEKDLLGKWEVIAIGGISFMAGYGMKGA